MNPKQQSFMERLKALLEAYDAKITSHARMEVENGVTTITCLQVKYVRTFEGRERISTEARLTVDKELKMTHSKKFGELVNTLDTNPEKAELLQKEAEYKEFRKKLNELLKQYKMTIKALDLSEFVIVNKFGEKWYEYHALQGVQHDEF